MGADFWSTTLSGIRRGLDWAAVAHYLEPVRRYLETSRRYRGIPAADRDDIAQQVMTALWERGAATYKPERGRFRTFVQGVIRHKVADYVRQHRSAEIAGTHLLPEFSSAQDPVQHEEEEAEAIEFSAQLVLAIQRFHDRYVEGPAKDRVRLYCFIGRLVGALGQEEIARKEGLSRDQVKRHLEAARGEILAELVALVATDQEGLRSGAVLGGISSLVREGVRHPERVTRLLGSERDERVRKPAETLLNAILTHRRYFFSPGSETWKQLLRGLAEVMNVDEGQLLEAWAR
ncbi:sigma-70 family RNA polymerase sigma factor [Planctomycetota bacterium]